MQIGIIYKFCTQRVHPAHNSTRRQFASEISSESPYLQICMLCRFLHRILVRSIRNTSRFLHAEMFRAKEQIHENNLAASRAECRPPISSRSPRAFSVFFFLSLFVAHCAVGAFNASTICIISSRKSRKARHRRDCSTCSRTTLLCQDDPLNFIFLDISPEYIAMSLG